MSGIRQLDELFGGLLVIAIPFGAAAGDLYTLDIIGFAAITLSAHVMQIIVFMIVLFVSDCYWW